MVDPTTPKRCRCGHDGAGEHPCHGFAYSCRASARFRLIPQPLGTYALAGMQPKLVARDTWACDACWERTREEMGR